MSSWFGIIDVVYLRQIGGNKTVQLRDELIYGHGSGKYIYFFAMIEDTILRFAWIVKVKFVAYLTLI